MSRSDYLWISIWTRRDDLEVSEDGKVESILHLFLVLVYKGVDT